MYCDNDKGAVSHALPLVKVEGLSLSENKVSVSVFFLKTLLTIQKKETIYKQNIVTK